MFRIMRASVVLPLPDSPMMAKISGLSAATEKLTPSTARMRLRAEQPAAGVDPARHRPVRSSGAVMRRLHGEAGDAMRSARRLHGRHLAPADVHRQRAARMEAAAGRRVGQVGRRAGQAGLRRRVADARQAGDEMRGVGMARRAQQVARSDPPRPAGPAYMTPSRSQRLACTARSCVTNSSDEPISCWISRIIASTPFCTTTSSAVVGSSAMMKSGRQTVASAIVTRWRMPPDSSCG